MQGLSSACKYVDVLDACACASVFVRRPSSSTAAALLDAADARARWIYDRRGVVCAAGQPEQF
eukprot:6323677-Pyramimonas_sp.AAC.1